MHTVSLCLCAPSSVVRRLRKPLVEMSFGMLMLRVRGALLLFLVLLFQSAIQQGLESLSARQLSRGATAPSAAATLTRSRIGIGSPQIRLLVNEPLAPDPA